MAEVNDYSCAQVLDRKTMEQVAVYHGRLDADQFGRELYKLGTFYNDATIAVERNNQGIATLYTLRDLNYPQIWFREREGEYQEKATLELGWLTDTKSKDRMISDCRKVIREKSLLLNDEHTLRELQSYVYVEHGTQGRWIAGAEQGEHDDRVIALCIAIQMYLRVPLSEQMLNPIIDEPHSMLTRPSQYAGSNDIMGEESSNEYF